MTARILMTLGLLSLLEPALFPRRERGVRVVFVERQAEPVTACECDSCRAHRAQPAAVAVSTEGEL